MDAEKDQLLRKEALAHAVEIELNKKRVENQTTSSADILKEAKRIFQWLKNGKQDA